MSSASEREYAKPLTIKCQACGRINVFNQPYAYHAGFGDQGFLYNDDGNLTLVWSAYDPDYTHIVGAQNPWAINSEEKQKMFEAWLPPAPHGGRWRFNNPARCLSCAKEISAPIGSNVYYVLYDGSVVVDGLSDGPMKSLRNIKE